MVHDEYRERSRAVWSKGDYAPASRQLEPTSLSLVAALGITAGWSVLDVAAGHGNCAVAAARRGATVTATDFSPTMIAVGSARTQAEGLAVSWQEADATDLPFADGSFDAATSVMGAIFAPAHDRVAAELVRVVRPGGRVGMTAWTPDGLTAQMIQIGREFGRPMPADAPDPFAWGSPEYVRSVFEPLGCDVEVQPRTLTFRYDSWDQWRRESEAHGMAVVARETMDPEVYQQMRDRMQAATAEHDYGEGDAVAFDSSYIEIIVRRHDRLDRSEQ